MRIEKVKIKNYKLFQDFTMTFNDDLNIITPLRFHHLPRGVVGCY